MPYPLPLTRTEAYLAYKAGVIQQSDLKPSLAVPRNGIDAWLAYWTGLAEDYPKREDGTPHILQEEEAYIAYLCGVINEYPEKCLRRVGAYLRYLISARWGRPDHPLNREELYLSLIKTQFIPSGDPSSDIVIDGTAKAAFVDVKMYGDTTQQTYSGAQIVKKQGFATPASDTVFWTITNATQSDISSDGFSTLTFSGTSFKNFFIKQAGSDIKASTTYTVIIELDKVSDLPFITVTQGNASSDSFPDFTVISLPDGAYTTSSGNATHGSVTMTAGNGGNIVLLGTTTSSLKTQTLRFFTSGSSTDGKKIRARVSIIEGDHTSDWQNYCGDNWQPYVGGTASPNPDYPQQIQTVTGEQTVEITGKNLFNKDNFVGGNYYVASTGTITEQANYRSVVVPCLPSTTYTVSKKGQSPLRVAYCNATSVQAGDTAYGYQRDTTANNQALTITTGEQAKTLVVTYKEQGYTIGTDITSLMIELGSTSTTYAPYNKQTLPISLGSIELCKLGAYQDYIWKDQDEWKVHKAIGKYIFTGEEDWTWDNARIPRLYLSSGILANLGIHAGIPPNANTLPIGKTNRFSAKTFQSFYTDSEGDGFAMSTPGQNFQIGDNSWSSELSAKADVVGLEWVYALATGYATDIVITNQALIDQLEALVKGGSEDGTTYIKVSAASPNLPAKLYVEAAKYI